MVVAAGAVDPVASVTLDTAEAAEDKTELESVAVTSTEEVAVD